MSDLPENFKSTINDLLNDLTNTYPEYKDKWSKWCDCDDDTLIELYGYMGTIFPNVSLIYYIKTRISLKQMKM